MTNSVSVNSHIRRIKSIDLLRGAVMIIMALDHVRNYFHFDAFLFSPTDLNHTTPGLFVTRWLTHLCAPAFVILAGTSAYFITQQKTIKETSYFLLTRGVWLILLQLTVIRFGWNFDPLFHFNSSNIISTIGFCMIALSMLIYFRKRIVLIIALTMIVGHNALDNISFEQGTVAELLWAFLHVQKSYKFDDGYSFSFVYPLIPWIGVMALGYCLGTLYDSDIQSENRKKILLTLTLISLFIFTTLRYINIYGDPVPWSRQSDFAGTMMSFFNVTKYPPSLLYLSCTLGISFMFLALMEGKNLHHLKPIILFGKVAMFYYVVHIYLIHLLALLAVIITGYPWQTMIFYGRVSSDSPLLKGSYGFNLAHVYLIWITVVLFLYPLCRSWHRFKMKHKTKWWITYV